MVSNADHKGRLNVSVTLDDADVDLDVEDLLHLSDDLREVAAARLYAKGLVSIGKAAELCGASVAEFIEKLGQMNIAVINYSVETLKHDLADW